MSEELERMCAIHSGAITSINNSLVLLCVRRHLRTSRRVTKLLSLFPLGRLFCFAYRLLSSRESVWAVGVQEKEKIERVGNTTTHKKNELCESSSLWHACVQKKHNFTVLDLISLMARIFIVSFFMTSLFFFFCTTAQVFPSINVID
jgi:hypothetical protein